MTASGRGEDGELLPNVLRRSSLRHSPRLDIKLREGGGR